MSVLLSYHSGPVVVSAASNTHIVQYLNAEKIHFKVLSSYFHLSVTVCHVNEAGHVHLYECRNRNTCTVHHSIIPRSSSACNTEVLGESGDKAGYHSV